MLHCLAGLDRVTGGRVFLGDIDISRVLGEGAHASSGATSIGFIFQSYNLIPTLNAIENITLPMALGGHEARPGSGSTR